MYEYLIQLSGKTWDWRYITIIFHNFNSGASIIRFETIFDNQNSIVDTLMNIKGDFIFGICSGKGSLAIADTANALDILLH